MAQGSVKAGDRKAQEPASLESAKSAIERFDRIAADRILAEITEKDPKSAQAWTLKGENYLALNRIEEARKSFETAAQLDPKSTAAFSGLGFTCLKLKDFGAAIHAYEEAVKADKVGGSSHLKLAGAYLAAGKEEEARKVLTAAGATMPEWGIEQQRLVLRMEGIIS